LTALKLRTLKHGIYLILGKTFYKMLETPGRKAMKDPAILESGELSDRNSTLVLLNYQQVILQGIASVDQVSAIKTAVSVATGARILGIPVVLSAIGPKRNGFFTPHISSLFPGQEVITRRAPGFDAFEDEMTFNAVKRTGRKKVVLAGLLTSGCFAATALHGIKAGYDVYGLMDAAGDSTPAAHENGIQQMIQAGVIPITINSLMEEWMQLPSLVELERKRNMGVQESSPLPPIQQYQK
jgi:nicotinamidase-related amidase